MKKDSRSNVMPTVGYATIHSSEILVFSLFTHIFWPYVTHHDHEGALAPCLNKWQHPVQPAHPSKTLSGSG